MERSESTSLPTPAWRKQRKSTGARQQLSQDLIVDTAIRVLDAEGLDAVSMRRVAQELDTGPASLYAHVSNKEELLDLMLDRVCEEMRIPAEPDPARWREQVKEIAYEIHRVLSEHADIARVPLGSIPTGASSLRMNEMMLSVMLAGGVPPRAAAWGAERIYLYVNADAYDGSIHLAKQRASGMERDEYMARFLGQVRDFFANLPADRFPATVRNVGDLMSGDGEDRFEFGLEMLVRGIASYVPANDQANDQASD
ncbi:TetR/AcrR family transcriptional regulator [Spirillospora sp. NPDC047279]|uniref:TetR/AcrR family transcriptional regulator n=1 Tax=Spirillospora sp. NPDC047279 TaxID=3155478 RepID=UPI003404CD91